MSTLFTNALFRAHQENNIRGIVNDALQRIRTIRAPPDSEKQQQDEEYLLALLGPVYTGTERKKILDFLNRTIYPLPLRPTLSRSNLSGWNISDYLSFFLSHGGVGNERIAVGTIPSQTTPEFLLAKNGPVSGEDKRAADRLRKLLLEPSYSWETGHIVAHIHRFLCDVAFWQCWESIYMLLLEIGMRMTPLQKGDDPLGELEEEIREALHRRERDIKNGSYNKAERVACRSKHIGELFPRLDEEALEIFFPLIFPSLDLSLYQFTGDIFHLLGALLTILLEEIHPGLAKGEEPGTPIRLSEKNVRIFTAFVFLADIVSTSFLARLAYDVVQPGVPQNIDTHIRRIMRLKKLTHLFPALRSISIYVLGFKDMYTKIHTTYLDANDIIFRWAEARSHKSVTIMEPFGLELTHLQNQSKKNDPDYQRSLRLDPEIKIILYLMSHQHIYAPPRGKLSVCIGSSSLMSWVSWQWVWEFWRNDNLFFTIPSIIEHAQEDIEKTRVWELPTTNVVKEYRLNDEFIEAIFEVNKTVSKAVRQELESLEASSS
ncbi:hypothetical protein D9758_005711 [Tetrapyrgos nigripes]|uniref:Uncharacterized protein n=1 Tax=Tetrapyrgos nigripes TaxID=182062 RepID=A0A8H5GKB2_9AGAR|nr:hypothetical protein D9758_005711 [Tetrapyrgos nigripes]